MAQPTLILECNEGSQGTPSWQTIDTALRFTGPGGIGDPFIAPVLDATDAFTDNAASPNDGECWHDTTADAQITVAGRNTNTNVVRVRETGATDGTADPPEFTAYDDATDAGNRTAPTIWLLTGTTGSSSISLIRACDASLGAPTANWTGQSHDADPYVSAENDGRPLAGNGAGDKVTTASALAASGTNLFNVVACLPHDPSQTGVINFTWSLQYTWS